MLVRKAQSLFLEIFPICVGVLLASIGLKAFLLPNGFLDGGVTGIAILLNKLFGLSLSWGLLLISIPFFILGHFVLTRRVLFKSVLAILALALAIHFENFSAITEDKVIIAFFGGIFLGSGIGLAIRAGAVLDGSEIIGIYGHDRFGVSIGSIVLVFNIVLFAITALVLSPEIAMYSILTFVVTGKAIDFTIQGFENYVGLTIISPESETLQKILSEQHNQGITVYQGKKGYGKRGVVETQDIIHIIVNRIEVKRIHRVTHEIDPDAFIVEFDVNNVSGGKLRKMIG